MVYQLKDRGHVLASNRMPDSTEEVRADGEK